jgi:hypothetical protein
MPMLRATCTGQQDQHDDDEFVYSIVGSLGINGLSRA